MHQGVQEAFAGMPTTQGLYLSPFHEIHSNFIFWNPPYLLCNENEEGEGRHGV